MSRNTATATPAETVTIWGGPNNEDGPNSDAGFLHGDPGVEPQGRESNDNEAESGEALASLSLESKNVELLRYMKALKEHNQLPERIRQLEEEQNIIVK
jgi:hypothetical protein